MAKYTTQVRSICEVSDGLTEGAGYADVDSVITIAAPKIFNFDYPIFDETYRLPLEKKILKHYYTREIGLETVGLWKLKLDAKMNEIMPYYNQLYKSTLIEYNPLHDTDLTREHEGEGNAVSRNETSGNSTTKNSGTVTSHDMSAFSDTPQGGLQDIESNTYLTSATKSDRNTVNDSEGTNVTSGKSSGSVDSTDKYIEHIYGATGGLSFSKRILDFRKTFLNIDKMVIDDLKDLFFLLW